jgi:signal transduction histidine kinase
MTNHVSPSYRQVFSPAILACLLFFVAFLLRQSLVLTERKAERMTRRTEKIIRNRQADAATLIQTAKSTIEREGVDGLYHDSRLATTHRDEMQVMVYRYDSLVYWSDNTVPLNDSIVLPHISGKSFRLDNGWYLSQGDTVGDHLVVCVMLVKHGYIFKNQYLPHSFRKGLGLPGGVEVSDLPGNHNIRTEDHTFLFSLSFPEKIPLNTGQVYLLFLICLAGFIFFTRFLYLAHKYVLPLYHNRTLFIIFFSFDLLLVRFLLFYFRIPGVLYASELFSPGMFASSALLPSLGDFMVNAVVILSISIAFYRNFRGLPSSPGNRIMGWFLLFFVFIIGLALFTVLQSLLRALIVDSRIPLNLGDISGLTMDSCLGLLIMASLLLSFHLFCSRLILSFLRPSPGTGDQLLAGAAAMALYAVFMFTTGKVDLPSLVFLACYFSTFIFLVKRQSPVNSFSVSLLYILLFSLFSTYELHTYNRVKEHETRKLLPYKLSDDRDPVSEYLFRDLSTRMHADTTLAALLRKYPFVDRKDETSVVRYLQDKFFTDYWKRFNVQFTFCDPGRVLNIQPEGYLAGCHDYFGRLVDTAGVKIFDDLYYIDYDLVNDNYLALVEFDSARYHLQADVTLFIEYYQASQIHAAGYTELLVDRANSDLPDMSDYSYARYEDGNLIYNYGKYFYSSVPEQKGGEISTGYFFNESGYDHMLFRVNEKTTFVISRKNPNFIENIAPFSYLVLFYGLFVILVLALIRERVKLDRGSIGFKVRIQYSIVAIIVASFVFIGISSLVYIRSLNEKKNRDNLSEKAHSILIELEHKLADKDRLTHDMQDYLAELLNKFSVVFFSDINLYHLNGDLLASSRPEMFSKGLLGTRMNPAAYREMKVLKRTFFIHDECIGKYRYMSAYLPFRNIRNRQIAYLNLPYFARQNELTSEISVFLVAFINIYVILIVIAIFIALFISNYISRPIELLRDKISRLKLGKTNEKIEWEKEDEIGTLIAEYNNMVDQLARSAEMLARSERESAWREMAKQVAHEIKNPLTPIKLSVQYLKKAWDDKVPDYEDRLKRFTHTIIEQIDTLSAIASEFSHFADMPKVNKAKVNLPDVVRGAMDLFKNTTRVGISLRGEENGPYHVLGDREQLLRVFNNLIKNSIQAIRKEEEGRIEITLSTEAGYHVVGIADNGAGIPKEKQDNIFLPSFTTKSGGMGLGLAMSKSIVVQAGGTIGFVSEENKGTTFTLKLPVFNEEM